MKKNEKIGIMILALVAIIVIVVLLVNRSGKDKQTSGGNNGVGSSQVDNGQNGEEFVSRQEDGTKVNISNKIKETKRVGGLEITGLTITEKDNLAQLLGTVTNVSSGVEGNYTLKIIVLDKDNQEIIDMLFSVSELQPGQSVGIDSSATFDFSNAYDIRFEKM